MIVLEKTYAAGGDVSKYRDFLVNAVQEIARQRGWRAAVPFDAAQVSDADEPVVIPASQNGPQYEDGASAIVEGTIRSMPSGSYTLKVRYLS